MPLSIVSSSRSSINPGNIAPAMFATASTLPSSRTAVSNSAATSGRFVTLHSTGTAATPARLDLGDRLREAVGVDVGAHDRRAGRSEDLAGGGADAARGTGDHRHAAVHPVGVEGAAHVGPPGSVMPRRWGSCRIKDGPGGFGVVGHHTVEECETLRNQVGGPAPRVDAQAPVASRRHQLGGDRRGPGRDPRRPAPGRRGEQGPASTPRTAPRAGSRSRSRGAGRRRSAPPTDTSTRSSRGARRRVPPRHATRGGRRAPP